MRDNKPILTAMQSQETTFNLILLLTTIAAGFAIASILIMAVVSKFKELGILKAMGATRMQIVSIFTLQGALLSFLGGLVGTGLSILFIKFLHTFESRDEAGFASKTFSIVEINVTIIFVAIGIAVLVGFLAALYPAWRAAKVNPIEVIRGA
jgi:lipoprotein-releasing system permease protein